MFSLNLMGVWEFNSMGIGSDPKQGRVSLPPKKGSSIGLSLPPLSTPVKENQERLESCKGDRQATDKQRLKSKQSCMHSTGWCPNSHQQGKIHLSYPSRTGLESSPLPMGTRDFTHSSSERIKICLTFPLCSKA